MGKSNDWSKAMELKLSKLESEIALEKARVDAILEAEAPMGDAVYSVALNNAGEVQTIVGNGDLPEGSMLIYEAKEIWHRSKPDKLAF